MDVRKSPAFKKARDLSFVQFAIQRSMGMMRIGSSPPTSLNKDWKHQLTSRNPINCQEKTDKLLFNEDGSLLLMGGTSSGTCRLFDAKQKRMVDSKIIKLQDQYLLFEILMTGPNEVATLSASRAGLEEHLAFWDLRKTSLPVSSSILQSQKGVQCLQYSKKDDLLLIQDTGDRLAVYSRAGVKQQTGRESSTWMNVVRNAALSPDETILVMETFISSYIIVRKVNLDTLIQDLQYLQPVTVTSSDGQGRTEAVKFYDDNERPQNSSNVPKILNYSLNYTGDMCSCFTCNKPAIFTPKSDLFVNYDMYLQDGTDKSVKTPVVRLFDLQNQQRQQHCTNGLPPNFNDDSGDDLETKCHLNQPLIEMTMREPFPTRTCYGDFTAARMAVTSLNHHTVIAIANDFAEHIKLLISNDDHIMVQHQLLLVEYGQSMAFSPNNFSFVMTDIDNNLQWMDIEYCGRLVDSNPRTNGICRSVPFDLFEKQELHRKLVIDFSF